MKKYIFAAMMAVASAFSASAQDSGYGLLVNTRDGNAVEFAFEYCPTATFEGNEMVIIDEDHAESIRYNMADIMNMTIRRPGSKVEGVTTGATLKIAITGNTVSVEGLEPGAVVSVCNISGAHVASATAGEDGSAAIAVGSLGKGVYVVSMPGNSFKFIR